MEAKVIMVRCEKCKKPFGARIEKRENGWWVNWAFKIDDKIAKSEGFDSEVIEGQVFIDEEYPGCVHCGSKGIVICKCGKVTCWEGQKSMRCGWCNQKSFVTGGAGRVRLKGGGF